jgi:uncharacterized protein (TIGR02466 family)
MNFDTINIFPTTIYVGKMENHVNNKQEFYKVYPKFDFNQIKFNKENRTRTVNTVSENEGNPLIHLEENLDQLFGEICDHIKNYTRNTLRLKDIFDIVITKSWLSRAREYDQQIPWHIHSTSHISFVYYLNIPEDSHSLEFSNEHAGNAIFSSLFYDDPSGKKYNMVEEHNEINSEIFYLTPQEGNVVIFPSKQPHSTGSTSSTFKGERLAIVGDVSLILKEEFLSYSYGYIHEKYWKKYS